MNSSDECHTIEGCPGLYVDAFKGHFLRKTNDPSAFFILSHYHGDHYQQLPREGKYRGPAIIHCTPVTANLLINVHQVPEHLVMSHPYGSTFEYPLPTKSGTAQTAKITFYDAHHCPGACIILIELPNGNVHIHTGDMRYNESLFQSFPRLQEAVKHNTIDTVYLDTTYSHPKHDFCPQEEAVNQIARQTKALLEKNSSLEDCSNDKDGDNTLVLLSCYSIGKEKVLCEASRQCQQPVYVTDKKWRMLQCTAADNSDNQPDQDDYYIRGDSTQSDIHVIPMGLAGEMWPFFRPNFQKVATYVTETLPWSEMLYQQQQQQELSSHGSASASSATITATQQHSFHSERRSRSRTYNKVVAFIPTGWAEASNWNKKNAVSSKEVIIEPPNDGLARKLQIEVRLVPYSEHSSFSELVSFVRYLKPRRVIPTVFSDEADRRRIMGRFRNCLDQVKAKKAFFRTMVAKESDEETSAKAEGISNNSVKLEATASTQRKSRRDDEIQPATASSSGSKREIIDLDSDNDSDCEIVGVVSSPASDSLGEHNEAVNTLVAMGFQLKQAKEKLSQCENNVQRAIEMMLQSTANAKDSASSSKSNKAALTSRASPVVSSPSISPDKKRKRQNSGGNGGQITDFFKVKR